ncbi:MAG: hypothetical protein PHH47_03345 [Gallionella sp.]|nr:hypothetical protein [Gallionella sp.]MDD4946250.1 hypothetical protein [Gallionella sp.]
MDLLPPIRRHRRQQAAEFQQRLVAHPSEKIPLLIPQFSGKTDVESNGDSSQADYQCQVSCVDNAPLPAIQAEFCSPPPLWVATVHKSVIPESYKIC